MLFRFDDRPQVALQIVHAGEPRLSETHFYRLDQRPPRSDVLGHGAPRPASTWTIAPDGVTRRIAVDTFINKELPPRYRSFTLVTSYVFGERKFRILTESVEPEWSEQADDGPRLLGPRAAATSSRPTSRSCRTGRRRRRPWALDPVELVKRRFPDARDVRLGVKEAGVAVVDFERASCSAHVVVYQPLRRAEGEKSIWDFAVIRVGGGAGVRVPGRGADQGRYGAVSRPASEVGEQPARPRSRPCR